TPGGRQACWQPMSAPCHPFVIAGEDHAPPPSSTRAQSAAIRARRDHPAGHRQRHSDNRPGCARTDDRSGPMPDTGIDRSSLPIRRPPFEGTTKRTLEGSEPDWNQASHVQPPEAAPNVLLVLIDDAGFGNPSTFGGPIATPNYT